MNKFFFGLLIIMTSSCERKPYVDHKLKFEKISEDCRNEQPSFRMVSNIGGERFEFQECLTNSFQKENMKVSRQGDTVIVKFEISGEKNVLFKLTLDIDSYPKYNYITVGSNTFAIATSHN